MQRNGEEAEAEAEAEGSVCVCVYIECIDIKMCSFLLVVADDGLCLFLRRLFECV